MDKIKVALVDEHPIMCDGIKALLSDANDIEIVHHSRNIEELMRKLTHDPVHVGIVALYTPDPENIEKLHVFVTNIPALVCWYCRCTGSKILFLK